MSNVLTAAILASGVDGGPSVDIGKPMAIHKTTTRIKMDNKHQCCRRKWTPAGEKENVNIVFDLLVKDLPNNRLVKHKT